MRFRVPVAGLDREAMHDLHAELAQSSRRGAVVITLNEGGGGQVVLEAEDPERARTAVAAALKKVGRSDRSAGPAEVVGQPEAN